MCESSEAQLWLRSDFYWLTHNNLSPNQYKMGLKSDTTQHLVSTDGPQEKDCQTRCTRCHRGEDKQAVGAQRSLWRSLPADMTVNTCQQLWLGEIRLLLHSMLLESGQGYVVWEAGALPIAEIKKITMCASLWSWPAAHVSVFVWTWLNRWYLVILVQKTRWNSSVTSSALLITKDWVAAIFVQLKRSSV